MYGPEELELLTRGGSVYLPSPDSPGIIAWEDSAQGGLIRIQNRPRPIYIVKRFLREADLICLCIIPEDKFDPDEGERLYWGDAIERIKAASGLRGFVSAKREAQLFVQINLGTTAAESIHDLTSALPEPQLDRVPHGDPEYGVLGQHGSG